MDNLVEPEPSVQNFKEPVENSLLHEMSSLTELTFFKICQIYRRWVLPNPEKLYRYLIDETQINDQICTQEQTPYVFTPSESNHGVIPPFPGAVYDCNIGNHTKNGGVKDNGDVDQ